VTSFAAVFEGKAPLVLSMAALVVTFGLTRAYTRLARVRHWGSAHVRDDVHLHHMAVGILLLLATGFATVAFSPAGDGRDLTAIVFGIGAALTLDEFALWLYLRDVYWSPEGRRSIDATLVGFLLGGLALLGSTPLAITGVDSVPRVVAFFIICVNAALAGVALLKGKLGLGLLSIFFPLIGLIASVRLAKPASLWARWFYTTDSEKLRRARRRFADDSTLTRALNRFEDLVGGAPHLPRAPVVPLRVIEGGLREAAYVAPAEDREVARDHAGGREGRTSAASSAAS
jgi:hypothetical protein